MEFSVYSVQSMITISCICTRNSEKSQRSQLDLCVVVFRTRSPASPEVGRLVEHSKRQVRGFVGCHKMLERDLYILVCLAFNHWHTGKVHSITLIYAVISICLLWIYQLCPQHFNNNMRFCYNWLINHDSCSEFIHLMT